MQEISRYSSHVIPNAFHQLKKKESTSDILVERLIAWEVKFVFGLVGDGNNEIIEAIRQRSDDITFIGVRHEESAAFMASGYSKATGKIGVCLSTTGPGAIHLMNGLYDAALDGASVLAITGSTYQHLFGTSFMQEVDTVALMKDVAHFNTQISNARHALTVVDLACRSVLSRGGVAHLSLPINVQSETIGDEADEPKKGSTVRGSSSWVAPLEIPIKQNLQLAAELLNQGKKIMILSGRGALGAQDELIALAQRLKAPVAKALLGKGALPDDSPYTTGGIGDLGTLPSKELMQECDTLLILGSNMPYTDYYPQPGKARAIQVDADPERLGLRYPIEVGLVGDVKETIKALLPLLEENKNSKFLEKAQLQMMKWREKLKRVEDEIREKLKPQMVVATIEKHLQPDALIAFDCGAHTLFGARHLNFKEGQQLIVSGNLATMAAGLPYAIAGKLAYPQRQTVALVGDGGFTMLMGEVATAVQLNLNISIIIFKNNNLGMIVKEQEELGNKPFGVELQPIDFAQMARACGALAYHCDDLASLEKSLTIAFSSSRVCVIEVDIDPKEQAAKPEEV